ncbi:MAG: hypothetical protein AAB409_06675, partial [Gemmatimonadota bacterium]
GHLVQVPRSEAARIAALAPEVWTVFNLQKAREVSEAAGAVGRAPGSFGSRTLWPSAPTGP